MITIDKYCLKDKPWKKYGGKFGWFKKTLLD